MSDNLSPARPALFLTDADVSSISDWKAAIDALRRAYAAQVNPLAVPPRTMARGEGVWLRSLTAISPLEGYMGAKLIAASPRARCASYLISLFDQETMNLDALIDGNQITGIRTAATAALAVDALAPQRPLTLAMLGSGFEARSHLRALAAVRDIQHVKVFSPNPAKRQAYAEHFRSSGLQVEAAAEPAAAVAAADVVICAARARNEEPILQGQWLEAAMTVVSIGSTLPEQREVAVEVIARARTIVADMPQEVAHETGDMRAASAAGIEFMDRLVPLGDIIGGRRLARAAPEDIVVYKSVGSALQDVVIAEMLYRRAREAGLGTVLPVNIAPVSKG